MDLWTVPPYALDTRHIDHGLLKRLKEKAKRRGGQRIIGAFWDL